VEKTVLQLENTTSFTASKIVFSYNGYGYLVDEEHLYKVSPSGVVVKEVDCSGCLDLASSGEYIYVLKQYTGVKNGESTIELQLIIYNIDLEQEEVVTLLSLSPVVNITGFIESHRDKLLVAARVWNQSDSSDYWNLYYYSIPWREPIQYTPYKHPDNVASDEYTTCKRNEYYDDGSATHAEHNAVGYLYLDTDRGKHWK
jgi:hypothetical protein